MAKSQLNDTLIAALVDAGLVDDPNNTARVLIDIQPGRIPMVYVEKFGHPDAIARVLAEHFGPANLVPPVPDTEEV